MTREEAFQKAEVLTRIIAEAITEFNELNNTHSLGLDLSDNSVIYEMVTDSAESSGWSSSNC
jgi:hypothetical protein